MSDAVDAPFGAPAPALSIEALLESPQLGEFVFQQITVDPTIAEVSEAHYQTMRGLLRDASGVKPQRLLELGAYRHFSAHLLAERDGVDAVLSDISPQALESGLDLAQAVGLQRTATLVAADFHELPFSDGYFDVVFIASSVHHTRRPECVLAEMLRVLRPGGILWLDNEPVARELCFYRFSSNRVEALTPFEQTLHARGLLHTVSSPFLGARTEALFAMVENDRIPLDLYLNALSHGASIEQLTLNHVRYTSVFDRDLLQHAELPVHALSVHVARMLQEALLTASSVIGPIERALGFDLPTQADIWSVARRSAMLIKESAAARSAAERDHALARLFGAALQARVRKAPAVVVRVESMFRTAMVHRGACLIEREPRSLAALLALRPLLPDVHRPEQEDAVRAYLPAADWGLMREAFGANSLFNRGPRACVPLRLPDGAALLAIRAYTVPDPRGPYRIVLRQGARLLAEAVVAQAETKLFKAMVYADQGDVELAHYDLVGRPLELAENLRVGVLQLLVPDNPPGG